MGKLICFTFEKNPFGLFFYFRVNNCDAGRGRELWI